MTRNNTNLMGDAGLAGLSPAPKPKPSDGLDIPEVTVAMAAYNTAAYIQEAIASVLCQQGISFELIVVDDGSEDDTGEKVRNFKDPRIRFHSNEKNRGIGFCHNLIIELSRAPFITHVDADDVVLRPDALAKMVHRVRSSERIGQAHCYRVRIDARGRVSRDAFLAMREREFKTRSSSVDYRRNLLVFGSVNNSLRTYRKEVFSRVGLFDEGLKRGVDYHMALRVVEWFEIAVVPELLYAVRKHGRNTSELSYFRNFRYWCDRALVCRKLLNQGMISFPREKRYDKNRLLGFPMTGRLQRELQDIDLLEIGERPAEKILLIESGEEIREQELRARLEGRNARVEHQHLRTERSWMDDMSQILVPHRILQGMLSWLSENCP